MTTSQEIPGCLSETVAASSVYSSISPSSLREVTRSRIFGATRASALYLRDDARDDSREVATDEVTDNANIVSSQSQLASAVVPPVIHGSGSIRRQVLLGTS